MNKRLLSLLMAFALVMSPMTMATVHAEYGSEIVSDDDKDVPSESTTINLNELKSVTVGGEDGDVKWFTFSPEETGTYIFSASNISSGDYVDSYGGIFLYDQNTNFLTYLDKDDDSGDGNHFSVSTTMQKGKTYYLAATLYNTSYGSRSYAVTLMRDLTKYGSDFLVDGDIDVPSESTPIELDELKNVTVGGEDGDVKWFTFTPTETHEYVFKSNVKDYSSSFGGIYLFNEDGQYLSFIDRNYDDDEGEFYIRTTLEAGKTYYLGATLYKVTDQSKTYAVSLFKYYAEYEGWDLVNDSTKEDLKNAKKLVLNESEFVTISYDDNLISWYSFTPEETGVYAFYTDGKTSDYKYIKLCKLYTEDDGDEYIETIAYSFDMEGSENNLYVYATLRAGETYYLAATMNFIDRFSETATYSVNIYKDFIRQSDVLISGGDLDVPSNTRVIGVDEKETVKIDVKGDTISWFTFTPEESGTYAFYSISDDQKNKEGGIYFLNEQGKVLETISTAGAIFYSTGDDYNNFLVAADLVAGQTYYLATTLDYLDSFSEIAEYSVAVYKNYKEQYCTDVIKTNGNMDVPAEDITKVLVIDESQTVTINADDNSVAWFTYTPEESGRYAFYSTGKQDASRVAGVYVYDENSKMITKQKVSYNEDYLYEFEEDIDFLLDVELEAGKTYYFATTLIYTNSISEQCSYEVKLLKDYEAYESEIDEYEDYIDLSDKTFKELEDDQTDQINLNLKGVHTQWYTFTPKDSGSYTVYIKDVSETTEALLGIYTKSTDTEYKAMSVLSTYGGECAIITVNLEAGKTYYIGTGLQTIDSIVKEATYNIGITSHYVEAELVDIPGASFDEENNQWVVNMNVGETFEVKPVINDDANPYITGGWEFLYKEMDEQALSVLSFDKSDKLIMTAKKAGTAYVYMINGNVYWDEYFDDDEDWEDDWDEEDIETSWITIKVIVKDKIDWDEPSYKWADDYSSVTATIVSKSDSSIVETETVNTSESGTSATCTVDGHITYTAKFSNNLFTTQTHTMTVKAKGHDWDEGKVTKEATCTEPGEMTVTCKNDDTHTRTEEIKAKGHDYEATIDFAEDGKTATATFKCKNCDESSSVEATVTSAVKSAATTEAAGVTTYTATAEYNGQTVSDTKDVEDIAQIGDVVLSTTSYTYNGKTKKPSVVVYDVDDNEIAADYFTVTYASGRKNVGKYDVTVTFNGEIYEGTASKSFSIKPKGTSLVSVTKAKKAFTAKWKKMSTKMSKSRITGYQIQYSTSKTFAKGNKTKKVKKYTSTSKKITGLKSKKTYYVRVRTYKVVSGKTYYSKWSAKKSVKTK